ncbi:MAG: glycosyltransferase [Gemmatimonadota bacterium]|nr:glycosyltransferase [Gemmatimonadota bacterium]
MNLLHRVRAARTLIRAEGFHAFGRIVRRLRGRIEQRRTEAEQIRRWLSAVARARPAVRVCRSPAPVRVLLFGEGDEQRTRDSLLGAGLPASDVCRGEAPPAVERPGERWVALAAGDEFVSDSGNAWLGHIADLDEGGVLYADEVRLAPGGSLRGDLKPAWSPLLALTHPGRFPGAATAIPAQAASRRLREGADWTDVLLRATDEADAVRHLPLPVLRRPERDDDPLFGPLRGRMDAVASFLADRGTAAPVSAGDDPETLSIHPRIDADPLVSLLIPTRDQPDLLGRLLNSIERLDGGVRHEVILVDHLTTDPRALHLLEEAEKHAGVRVIREGGSFNFARITNTAAAEASGDFLLMLNNDTEAIDGAWLTHLVAAMHWPGVDAVGARLLYPDGTCQHAGIGLGIGTVAGHLGREWGSSGGREVFPGTGARTAREVSAATAACLLVRRGAFEELGGLDAGDLPVSFNDVDLCLRLTQRGGRILYEPRAELIHHETRTRSRLLDPREVITMRQRWRSRLTEDPLLPIAMNRESECPFLDPHRARLASTLR